MGDHPKSQSNLTQSGDTVYIRAGTYDEIIEPFISGSEGNKITYKNYINEDVTIIRGEEGKNNIVSIGYAINGNWDPKNYIVIDGFEITHIDPTSVVRKGDRLQKWTLG